MKKRHSSQDLGDVTMNSVGIGSNSNISGGGGAKVGADEDSPGRESKRVTRRNSYDKGTNSTSSSSSRFSSGITTTGRTHSGDGGSDGNGDDGVDDGTEEKDDDKKRRWMSKEQAKVSHDIMIG